MLTASYIILTLATANVMAGQTTPPTIKQLPEKPSTESAITDTTNTTLPLIKQLPQNSLTTENTQTQPPYMVELPIKDESEDERKQGFTKALEQILIKNSDNPQLADLATIKDALANPSIYVQRYTYTNRNALSEQKILFLQVQFNRAAITRLLQQAKSIEHAVKQQTLIWLVKTPAFGAKIIEYEGSNDVIVPIFKKSALNLGMSVIFPVLDLQDVSHIKANDICSLHIEIIKNASQRYGTDAIVAGCLQQPITGNMWTSQWLLLSNNKSNNFSFTGLTAEDVITQAMHAIAPNITNTTKPPINHPTTLILRITNINGLNQYNEIVRYLTAFRQITQVDLIKISPGEVELRINTIGNQQTLFDEINAQNKLIRNPDMTTLPSGIDLDYKWIDTNNEQSQPIVTRPLS